MKQVGRVAIDRIRGKQPIKLGNGWEYYPGNRIEMSKVLAYSIPDSSRSIQRILDVKLYGLPPLTPQQAERLGPRPVTNGFFVKIGLSVSPVQ